MPASLGLIERVIVKVFVFGDFGLQRDIFSNIETIFVKQQSRKQPAHSAVPVVERMDTQKIVNKNRNRYERLNFHIPDNTIIFLTNPIQCFRCFIGRQRGTLVLFDQREYEKQPPAATIRKGGGDYISYRFSATSAGTQYDSCRVSYTDPATGKVIEGVAKSGDYDEEAKNHKRLEITARVKSAGEAQALAENHLRLHNKFAKTARFSLPGDSGMVAGVTVMLEGWASFGGKYLVSRAVHTVNASGYTTDIELRKVL